MLKRSVVLLLTFLSAESLSGQATIPAQLPCPSSGCGTGLQFVVHISSEANVRLENGMLNYHISDVLQNTGGRNAEVNYLLPLPRFAAFHDMTMSINGEMISGDIMAAGRAKNIYETIARTNRDPALVEWVERDLLRTRIFPIFPAERKVVDLRLQAVAQREGNTIRIDYRVGGKRGYMPTPAGTPAILNFSYPDSAHYGFPLSPDHSVVSTGISGGRRHVRVIGRGDLSLFLPVLPSNSAAIEVVAHARDAASGYALIKVTPPAIARSAARRDIVLALDVSASMSGRKLETARDAVRKLLATLTPQDRFRIVDFSRSVHSSSKKLVAATPANVRLAQMYLAGLVSEGKTNTVAALDNALGSFSADDDGRSQIVLLISDGGPNLGEIRYESIMEHVAQRRGRARIFTFALSPTFNGVILEEIARRGGGKAQLFRRDEAMTEAVASVVNDFEAPIVSSVRLKTTGVRIEGIQPLGSTTDLFAGRSGLILARYSGSGPATITVEGRTEDGPVTWSSNVVFPSDNDGDSFASRLWATEKVAAHFEQRRVVCTDRTLDAEMALLGKRHSIPTPQNSYLILDPAIQISADGRVLNALEFVTGRATAPAPAVMDSSRRSEPASAGGSNVVIQIRNPLSIRGYAQPLIIIDGVIQMQDDPTLPFYDNSALDLNGEEIESVEVIRGAAAAALYGQRAVNGVILITTNDRSGWRMDADPATPWHRFVDPKCPQPAPRTVAPVFQWSPEPVFSSSSSFGVLPLKLAKARLDSIGRSLLRAVKGESLLPMPALSLPVRKIP